MAKSNTRTNDATLQLNNDDHYCLSISVLVLFLAPATVEFCAFWGLF